MVGGAAPVAVLLLGVDLVATSLALQASRWWDGSSLGAGPLGVTGGVWGVVVPGLAVVLVVTAVLASLAGYCSRVEPRVEPRVAEDLPATVLAALAGGLAGSSVVDGFVLLAGLLLVLLSVCRAVAYLALRSSRWRVATDVAPDDGPDGPVRDTASASGPLGLPGRALVRDTSVGSVGSVAVSVELLHRSRGGELWGIPLVRRRRGDERDGLWRAWRVWRAADVVLAACVLLMVMPVLVGVTLALRYELGRGGVFVRRTRLGVDGRPFALLRFRTVHPTRGVGPVGRFVRRTSLNELPQLINVLRGDVSLSAPRTRRSDGDLRGRSRRVETASRT